MLYKLHYFLATSGVCAMSLLLGVFMSTYTDASSIEIGMLFTINPFLDMLVRPTICAMADRARAHKLFFLRALMGNLTASIAFIVIPCLGPELYEQHPRVCFYILMASKILGGLSSSVQGPMVDSLAINYAKRVGVEFSIYRVWGTISWMLFGVVIGFINEIPALPKYVPAFLILAMSIVIDFIIVWAWPDEYFEMVNMIEIEAKQDLAIKQQQDDKPQYKPKSKLDDFTRALLPKDVIWAHIKSKVGNLFCLCPPPSPILQKSVNQQGQQNISQTVERLDIKQATVEKQNFDDHHQRLEDTFDGPKARPGQDKHLSKIVQLRTLAIMVRRDPRLVMYISFLIIMGIGQAALGFIVIGLSHLCHDRNDCNFSLLAGFLQVSMASAETLLFIYVKDLKRYIDRVGMCIIALGCAATKYLLYGYLWYEANPYLAIANEILHGLQFGLFLTVMVDVAHTFSSQVAYLIPEFKRKEYLAANGDDDLVFKTSLAATMQAIMSTSVDGIGNGFGALFHGFLAANYGYHAIGKVIGYMFSGALVLAMTIKIYETAFNPQLGLDKTTVLEVGDKKKGQEGDTSDA